MDDSTSASILTTITSDPTSVFITIPTATSTLASKSFPFSFSPPPVPTIEGWEGWEDETVKPPCGYGMTTSTRTIALANLSSSLGVWSPSMLIKKEKMHPE